MYFICIDLQPGTYTGNTLFQNIIDSYFCLNILDNYASNFTQKIARGVPIVFRMDKGCRHSPL